MARAAQKTLAFHFARVGEHESGTLEGTDIEELHDMRVATRRMRAALRIFDGYLDPQDVRPLLKGLRRTGRALGTVRDLDVAGERVTCVRRERVRIRGDARGWFGTGVVGRAQTGT